MNTGFSYRRGISLVELLFALLAVTVIMGPSLYLFSSSRKVNYSSRRILTAMSLANSLATQMHFVNSDKLKELNMTSEKNLPQSFSLGVLGLDAVPKEFERSLQIEHEERVFEDQKIQLWQFHIKIDWVGVHSDRKQSYRISNLRVEKQNL